MKILIDRHFPGNHNSLPRLELYQLGLSLTPILELLPPKHRGVEGSKCDIGKANWY
jgi:hypothetical protein